MTMMCNAVSVSRSGYYAWKNHVPCARDLERRRLENLIVAIFDDSDHTYGYRRVHAQLTRQGEQIDDDTVRQIMGDLHLVACQPRPFRPVTTIAGDIAGLPDLVNRDFTATAPNRLWVADFTYVRTWAGFTYVAFVIDVFSRMIVGWKADTTMRADLVTDALNMASWARGQAGIVDLKGLVAHTDAGAQYTSIAYTERLVALGMKASIGTVGDAYDCQSLATGSRKDRVVPAVAV